MKHVSFTILLALLISCCSSNSNHCHINQKVVAYNDSVYHSPEFKKELRRIHNNTKVGDLRKKGVKCFRLTVFYTWDVDNCIYTYEKRAIGGIFKVREKLKDHYKKETGMKDTFILKKLDDKQCGKLEMLLERNCIWTMLLHYNHRGLDGRTYLLEVYDPDCDNPLGKEFAVIIGWSPNPTSAFGKMCGAIESFAAIK